MNKQFHIAGICFLFFIGMAMMSMMPDEGKKNKTTTIKPYLGYSDYSGGIISKKVFDSLLRQGVKAKDSAGTFYKVVEFTFGYGERNLYEDSTGKLVILTDYVSEICTGDTLSTIFQNYVFRDNRTKSGDTAYFDRIKLQLPDGAVITTKNMRFVLTK